MINFSNLKKFCIYNLIGCFILAAIVAVSTVLVGKFNAFLVKTLITLGTVVLHSLLSLSFSLFDNDDYLYRKFKFSFNTLFIIIIASFIASLFLIWNVLDIKTITKVYLSFFIILFAALHGEILSKALNKTKTIDILIFINFVFMAIVVIMLQPAIFIQNSITVLGEMFFRLLAACSIVDGTLTILTIIFYKLYSLKHRKDDTLQNKNGKLGIVIWILIIYLFFQIIVPIGFVLGLIIKNIN